MTRYLSIMTISAALSMTAGLAVAGDTVSADKILDALKPKPGVTRGLSTGPQQPADAAVQAKETTFVNTLRNRKTRSLSLGERQEIAELAASKPKIDLEIQFDYNSADISKESTPAVQEPRARRSPVAAPAQLGNSRPAQARTRCRAAGV